MPEDNNYGDLAAGIKSEGMDACEKALTSNWTAIFSAAVLEMI